MTTLRSERMIQSAPKYYETSIIYEQIQQAQADDYDNLDAKTVDLQAQLTVATATWGLKYWEEAVGLPVREADPYESRRGKITAKRIGPGNFSTKQLVATAAGYGENIRVAINVATSTVTITFQHGEPVFLDEYVELVENIVHAHLGVDYKFEWHIDIKAGIKADYVRYVYPLPICNTFNCGVWPFPIDQAYATGFTITAHASVAEVEHIYKFTNTIITSEGGLL